MWFYFMFSSVAQIKLATGARLGLVLREAVGQWALGKAARACRWQWRRDAAARLPARQQPRCCRVFLFLKKRHIDFYVKSYCSLTSTFLFFFFFFQKHGPNATCIKHHSGSLLVFRLQTQLHIGHVEYDLKLHLRQLSLPFHLAFMDLDAFFQTVTWAPWLQASWGHETQLCLVLTELHVPQLCPLQQAELKSVSPLPERGFGEALLPSLTPIPGPLPPPLCPSTPDLAPSLGILALQHLVNPSYPPCYTADLWGQNFCFCNGAGF